MFKYSQKLRGEFIEFVNGKHGVLLSHEKADEYLDSLADFFIAYNDKNIEA